MLELDTIHLTYSSLPLNKMRISHIAETSPAPFVVFAPPRKTRVKVLFGLRDYDTVMNVSWPQQPRSALSHLLDK